MMVGTECLAVRALVCSAASLASSGCVAQATPEPDVASLVPVGRLPTLGAVEDHPDPEVTAELFEAVNPPGRHEQHVPHPTFVAPVAVHEHAATLRDHVQLVAGV